MSVSLLPASLIEVTGVGSRTIGVDLMKGDSHCCSGLDLCDGSSCQSVFGIFSHINVTTQFCSATLVDNVGRYLGISNDGSVLLTRRDTRAVSCNVGVYLKDMLDFILDEEIRLLTLESNT